MADELSRAERVSDLPEHVSLFSTEVWRHRPKPGWVRKIVGSTEYDPDFAEIVNLTIVKFL